MKEGRVRLIAGITAVVLTGISSTAGASELRQRRYVNESSTVVWKESSNQVICDHCPPIAKRSWTAADFAERIIRIKVPSPEKREVTAKEKMPSELMEEPLVIYFDFNSSVIRTSDREKLQDFAVKIKEQGNTEGIEIEGYTDGVGSKQYNDSLASRRAEAVYKEFLGMGLSARQMKVKSSGKCCYVDSNIRSGNNRRVKVIHMKEGSEKPSR